MAAVDEAGAEDAKVVEGALEAREVPEEIMEELPDDAVGQAVELLP